MISEKALEEFNRIWKNQFNEEISDDKAMESATKLLTLMDIVYRPIKKEWLEKLEHKDKSNLASN